MLLAFVVGALTGAAVALLFAPASGEETREYLGAEGARGQGAGARCCRTGPRGYQRQRQSIASAVDRGREAFQQARSREEQGA